MKQDRVKTWIKTEVNKNRSIYWDRWKNLAGTSSTTLALSCDIIAATQEHRMSAEVEELLLRRKWPRINDETITEQGPSMSKFNHL